MQLQGARPVTSSLGANLAKTILQIGLVWSVFLWLIPTLLVRVEMAAALPTFASGKWSELGLLLFMASSTLFLICIWTIVWIGNGTPWPWDHSTSLVIAGPYRYLRNPMVLAGIGLGISSALILGSYLGFVYLVIGILAWNFVLRPMEEQDLAHRFGRAYIDYFQTVPAWLPSSSPYRSLIVRNVEDTSAED
jgi:protein-S-isoprenylcysteine O-methyltransferase Ste14